MRLSSAALFIQALLAFSSVDLAIALAPSLIHSRHRLLRLDAARPIRPIPPFPLPLSLRAPHTPRGGVPIGVLEVIGPRWLSLLPPVATLLASVLLRQVMLAMASPALILHSSYPHTCS